MSVRDLVQRADRARPERAGGRPRASRERMAACGVADAAAYLAQHLAGRTARADRTAGGARVVDVPRRRRVRRRRAPSCSAAWPQRPARVVRILSVPCAGGEEPYSMAMALRDAGVAPASFRIDAIDLSEVALARARRGRYTRNAFRGGDLAFRERYFTQRRQRIPDQRRAARAGALQPGQPAAPPTCAAGGRYDVVFCRNLLIYFDEPTTAAAIASLHALLADDGLLFAGYAEVPAFCRNGFAPLRVPGAFALQKAAAASAGGARRRAAGAHGAQAAARLRPLPVPRRPPRTAAAQAAPPAAGRAGSAHPGAGARARPTRATTRAPPPPASAARRPRPMPAEAYFILGLTSECEQQAWRPPKATGAAASTCSPTITRRCATWRCWPASAATPRRPTPSASAPRASTQRANDGAPESDSAMQRSADCWNQIGVAGDQSCDKLAPHVHCRNCDVYAGAAQRNLQRPVGDGYRAEWAAQLRQPVARAPTQRHVGAGVPHRPRVAGAADRDGGAVAPQAPGAPAAAPRRRRPARHRQRRRQADAGDLAGRAARHRRTRRAGRGRAPHLRAPAGAATGKASRSRCRWPTCTASCAMPQAA